MAVFKCFTLRSCFVPHIVQEAGPAVKATSSGCAHFSSFTSHAYIKKTSSGIGRKNYVRQTPAISLSVSRITRGGYHVLWRVWSYPRLQSACTHVLEGRGALPPAADLRARRHSSVENRLRPRHALRSR